MAPPDPGLSLGSSTVEELEDRRESPGVAEDYLVEMIHVVSDILCPTLDVLADLVSPSAAIDLALRSARELIGADIVYDQALFDSLDCEEFTPEYYEANDQLLRDGISLDEILSKAIAPHLNKAGSADMLRSTFDGLPGAHIAVDVLTHGARDFMVDEFVPNGGNECPFGPSYKAYKPICNDNMVKLAKKGRIVAFTLDELIKRGLITELHISPLLWAPKTGKVNGRVCLHLSKRSSTFESVNYSVDDIRANMAYPLKPLPLLPDLCELACQQRDQYPGELLGGATIDVSDGYHQFAQTVASAKRHATQILVPRADRLGTFMIVVCIYVVGIFGAKKAGNIFCAANGMVDEIHNSGLAVKRSVTYIDDTAIIGPSRLIKTWLGDAVKAAISVWGPGKVIQDEKKKCWEDRLIAIGWELDFAAWRAQPKARGMAKLFVALFDIVPSDTELVKERDMDHLKGLLQWYASGIPAGQAFLSSLYACPLIDLGNKRCRYRLSNAAKRDLTWWRAFVFVAYHHPHVLGVDIDAARRIKVPTMHMRTDASTSIGGGGLVSLTRGGEPLDVPNDAIRWTLEEMRVFKQQGISINTLEYYAAIYFVMLWAPMFEGNVVHLECDNTAAVSWLMKSRACAGNEAADAMTKIFSLFCLSRSIIITSSHLPGVANVVADFRSRDLVHMAQDGDETLCRGTMSSACTRQEICRRVLYTCVTKPWTIDGALLRCVLTSLALRPGSHTATL